MVIVFVKLLLKVQKGVFVTFENSAMFSTQSKKERRMNGKEKQTRGIKEREGGGGNNATTMSNGNNSSWIRREKQRMKEKICYKYSIINQNIYKI